jgi:hypothetical protein
MTPYALKKASDSIVFVYCVLKNLEALICLLVGWGEYIWEVANYEWILSGDSTISGIAADQVAESL